MRVVAAKDTNFDLLVRALIISLLVHGLAFGTWKFGQGHGWWQRSHLPHWLQLAQAKFIKQIAKQIPPRQQQPPQQLIFVDVDPSLAVAEPPKNAKYTSSANSVASSPKIADDDLPEIKGSQEKVLKTTDNSKTKPEPTPQPLRPTPKEKVAERPSPPPKTYVPGDLAFAKPNTNLNNGKSDKPEATPHQRPRTVAEAKALRGISGEKMKHEGGSAQLGNTSLDVRSTVTGAYDRIFVDAVQSRWDYLLQDQPATPVGEVRLEFKLHYDGRITDMKMPHNGVDAFFALLCQKAILDNAPYARWTPEMRRELAGDTRDVTFTFYYLDR